MAKYDNPGIVDVEKAAESILSSGGGINSHWEGDHIHNTVYSKDNSGQNTGQRLSWNEYPDGRITDVHSSKNGRSYMEYGN